MSEQLSWLEKFKRLPIVRHYRYFMAAAEYSKWWENVGRHLGIVPNQADIDHIDAIWRGEA